MSLDFDYSNTPLPMNSAEEMGVSDHANSAANYVPTGPNVGHFGGFHMRCNHAWASAQRLFSFISFLMQ